MENKHIKTFENFTIVDYKDLQAGTWDSERLVMAEQGRYPYVKNNGSWELKENPSASDYRNGVIYMDSTQARELNTLREEYLRIQDEYKRMEDSLKRTRVDHNKDTGIYPRS